MLPFPETGHINPMMQLAVYLSSCHGFIITFVNTQYNHSRMVSASTGHLPSELGLHIQLVGVPDGLSECDNRDNDVAIFVKIIENIGPVLEELIHKLNAEGPCVNCIISDVMAVKTLDVANTLGIPRIAFWPPNASIHAFICHAIHASSHGTFAAKGVPEPNEMISFPGIPPVKGSQLPWLVGSKEVAESIFRSDIRNMEALRQSKWILCNSVHELEATVQDFIPPGFPKVCPIGPILPSNLLEKNCSREDRITTSLWVEQDECLDWLDAQEPHSVMYVSVGSIALLNKEQLYEVAYGLEASGIPVLWVLRADLGGASSLPQGFMERNEGRITIVGWCPQLLVLSHIAIGSFLTHCGWNSTIEAMSMGVPMLVWPQMVDQFANAQLVVNVWGVGLELGIEGGQGIVSRAAVHGQVRKLMAAYEGVLVRAKASQIRLLILQATKEGGSSHESLLRFVHWIRQESEAMQIASTPQF